MGARRQYYWADNSETVFQTAEHLFALAGYDLVAGGEQSSEVGTLKPWYVAMPGEDLRGAILRGLSKDPGLRVWLGLGVWGPRDRPGAEARGHDESG